MAALGLFLFFRGQQTMGSCLVKPHCEARSLPRASLSPIFTWATRLSRAGQEEMGTHLDKRQVDDKEVTKG